MFKSIRFINRSGLIRVLLAIAMLASGLSSAYAQLAGVQFDTHPMHWARYWARGLFDRNLIYCPIWNIGNLTDAGLSPGQGMRWPGNQGLTTVGKAVFYIGSLVTDMSQYEGKVIPDQWDGEQLPIVSDSYFYHVSQHNVPQLSFDKSHQQIWAPVPGFFNDGEFGYIWGINEDVNGDGELSPAEDINYNGVLDYNLNPPESILKSMAISTDERTWPEYWPGGSYIGDDRPYYGRPPRTIKPGLRAGKWNGEYKAGPIADQETLYRMDDHENDRLNDFYKYETVIDGQTVAIDAKYWPMKKDDGTPDTRGWHDDVGIAGLGIEVEGRTYAWYHPLAEDLLVSVYRVRNYSDYVLHRIITGMWCDANAGGQGTYNTASYIKAQYDYEGEGGRLEFDILYQWYKYPDQLSTYRKIGTFGFAFLESPGIDYNGLDDDADYMIDESMENGIDDDGDWEPFLDSGLDRLMPGDPEYKGPDADGTEGNGKWDTEDTNLNGALDPGEDVNKNDKLDFEPINDDRGTDGIGPDENGWPGPDPDGSETNGKMDLGEPDFDLTDIDEADQAGLKIAYVYEDQKENLKDDRSFWYKYMIKDDYFYVEDTDENLVFTFGARAVRLERNKWKRFTIAMLMGEDQDDAIRNKATMQSIYDNNYRFLTPPLQPTLVSDVGDRRVQLYWDTDAEQSKDPFYGYDFNGYRVYKSTDPKFMDIKTISDAFGNVLLFKPIAIFDKKDGLKGAHPIPFPNLGVHYDMGDDTGLRHSYLDTLVDNGRTYYYAVNAIDAGNAENFYEMGLISENYPLYAMPSESPFNITVNLLGEVVYRDRNTAVCIPVEPAAGYRDPFVDSLKIEHVSGIARGYKMNIDVFNKHHVNLGHEYEITFTDDHYLDELTPLYEWGNTTGITCINVTTGDTMFHFAFDGNYEFTRTVFNELEKQIFEGIHYDFGWKSAYSSGRTEADVDRGIEIVKKNEFGRETNEWKRWVGSSKTNIRVQTIELTGSAKATPFDIEIRIDDHIGVDTSYTPSILLPSYPLNFTTWNVTDPNNPHRMKVAIAYDKHKNKGSGWPEEMPGQIWDSTRVTIMFPKHKEGQYWASWQIRFVKNPYDSLNPVIPPQPGDVFRFRTTRNPTRHDKFRFKVEGGEWKKQLAKLDMRDIYVVPDPYVVASSYEPIYELAGYQQRKVDFVNLPPKCTIKIFTASGRLVKEIKHEAQQDFGRASWDLTSEDGPEIAFGMYFFVVESDELGVTRGKFAVIK